MSAIRVDSSPDLVSSSTIIEQNSDDAALEGVAANIKLLLKLIQDHKDACDKEKNGRRRMLRVATMMTILDNVRDRIQKSQPSGEKAEAVAAELRRCNTDPKPRKDKKPTGEPRMDDDKEKLRRELAASTAARKNLQVMCSSLGKEKEIMAGELSRKVHELNGLEELINDLKAQNETLLEKVHECSSQHKEKKAGGGGGGESPAVTALQERNKLLSEQLLKSLDGYRSMKRKLKAAQEENAGMRGAMDEMGAKVEGSLERVRGFKERVSSLSTGAGGSKGPVDVREEIEALEGMFEGFRMMVEKKDKTKGECAQPKGEINARKSPVLA